MDFHFDLAILNTNKPSRKQNGGYEYLPNDVLSL